MTCTKQRLSFQNTPDNLHNVVLSLWDSFYYMQLYHSAIASDVDSFSTHSDGTKEKQQRKVEGYSNDVDIRYKLTPVVQSGLYKGIHPRTHRWTHTDIQCLQCHGWESMGPLLWYNLSWSSHDSPLFMITADVATLQEQQFSSSGVVGCLPCV